jgi:hypothetical protein
MGKASSAKKIKRVQQAGATRSPGQRRQLGYPALIAGILVVGLALTFLAVQHRRDVEKEEPAIGTVWHEAFGLYVCGEFRGTLQPTDPDAPIVLYPDGLIRVAPDAADNAGANATFALFFEAMGLQVTDTSITLPDGTTFNNGDDCGGQPGRVALYDWPPQAVSETEPRIISSAIAGTRFNADGRSYVLAFAPRDAEVSLPPSVDALGNPSDEKPKKAETTTSAAGETTTTVAGETTTTAAGDTTTTAAGEATSTTVGG